MFHFNANLSSLAVVLWSGMLIIAGSVWVLASQVRTLADIMEGHSRSTSTGTGPARRPEGAAAARPRIIRRQESTATIRRVSRPGGADLRSRPR